MIIIDIVSEALTISTVADVGFISPHYIVSESNGQVNIEIGLISGSLHRDVALNFYIVGLNAQGKSCGHHNISLAYSQALQLV